MPARLGEGLGADLTDQIGPIRQMGEEGIQLILDAGLEAADHGDQQDGEGQDALPDEGIGLEPGSLEKLIGMEVFDKLDKNCLVLRSAW